MKDADLFTEASGRAIRYMDGLSSRPVAPTPESIERLSAFEEKMPDAMGDAREVLTLLDDAGSPATVATAGPRFFGFVIGGSLPVTVAASWLATAWDQNPGLFIASPAAVTLEEVALRWLLDVLKWPSESAGAFVTGAAVANFTGLAAARHAVLQKAG